MSNKPEALRLADALRALYDAKKYHPSGPGGQICGSEQYRLVTSGWAFEDLPNAADELRRLVAENEEYMRDMQLTNEIAAEALFRASKAEAQRDELLTTLKKLEYSSDGYIKRYPEEAEVNAVIAKAEGKQ